MDDNDENHNVRLPKINSDVGEMNVTGIVNSMTVFKMTKVLGVCTTHCVFD